MASEGGLLGVLLPYLAQEWEARKAQTFNEVAGARAKDAEIQGRDALGREYTRPVTLENLKAVRANRAKHDQNRKDLEYFRTENSTGFTEQGPTLRTMLQGYSGLPATGGSVYFNEDLFEPMQRSYKETRGEFTSEAHAKRDPFKPIDIPSTKERKLSNQKKKRSKIATKGLRENQIRDFTSELVGGK